MLVVEQTWEIRVLGGKPNSLGRLVAEPKTGHETFRANGRDLGPTLFDFWRWSLSDLVSNATRGLLAEFIVAKALGISTPSVRDEWSATFIFVQTRREAGENRVVLS